MVQRILHNSLCCLCCSFFVYSVDEIRFNKNQYQVLENDTQYIEVVSMHDCYIMSIQLAFRVLNPDIVFQNILSFFGNDLCLEPDEMATPKIKGMETMMVYCVICLLSVVTSRNLIEYDLKVEE